MEIPKKSVYRLLIEQVQRWHAHMGHEGPIKNSDIIKLLQSNNMETIFSEIKWMHGLYEQDGKQMYGCICGLCGDAESIKWDFEKKMCGRCSEKYEIPKDRLTNNCGVCSERIEEGLTFCTTCSKEILNRYGKGMSI